MSYGLTPELADKLIAMGRDACDYFEHAVGAPMMWENGHKSGGCHLCERDAPGLPLALGLFHLRGGGVLRGAVERQTLAEGPLDIRQARADGQQKQQED